MASLAHLYHFVKQMFISHSYDLCPTPRYLFYSNTPYHYPVRPVLKMLIRTTILKFIPFPMLQESTNSVLRVIDNTPLVLVL